MFANKEECYAKCSGRKKNGKLANGVTVDTKTGKNCYCEYGMKGRNKAQQWTSTFIKRSMFLQGAVSLEPRSYIVLL